MGAVQTHNAVHCPIFKQRWLNKVYQVVLTNTYGHPVSSLVPGHTLSHHKHTQTRRDVMRTSKARFRWNLLNILGFLFIVAPYTMRADAAYTEGDAHAPPAVVPPAAPRIRLAGRRERPRSSGSTGRSSSCSGSSRTSTRSGASSA